MTTLNTHKPAPNHTHTPPSPKTPSMAAIVAPPSPTVDRCGVASPHYYIGCCACFDKTAYGIPSGGLRASLASPTHNAPAHHQLVSMRSIDPRPARCGSPYTTNETRARCEYERIPAIYSQYRAVLPLMYYKAYSSMYMLPRARRAILHYR